MRPNTERLLDPNIGDIVHNFLKDEYFLIVNEYVSRDNVSVYDVIRLSNGAIEEIGYWDYLYKTSWDIVA